MLTQSRNLNTISNNMVNIQTPGYKNETMVSSTFKEEMLYRTGQYSKENPTQLATVSKIKTAKQVYTNYDQGGLEQTDGIYDFALNGNGFFCIQTSQGIRYTDVYKRQLCLYCSCIFQKSSGSIHTNCLQDRKW